ncbi:L-amino acid amidase [Talaromyces islandicus]|uniref:L-amino acid amidase n=1 Tax=Talaromyces islandicus TaxID=28573 RepID=A0A0U1LUY3_TALIS|nr:L-amino acid amidase [Talaromyces islandicus]
MEGIIPFKVEGIDEPCYTWYKVYGDLKKTPDNIKPLVLYPGGPGACHDWEWEVLVLASTPSSVKLLNEHDKVLLSQFPQDVQEAYEKAEKECRFDSDEYQQAAMAFYKKHICRADPWPRELEATLGHLGESMAYKHMYGPSELTCTGILKDWDTAPVASQIQAPTLLVNGQHDEVGDLAVQPFFDTIPRVRWVTLDGASHMAHIEVRRRFMEVLSRFLLR